MDKFGVRAFLHACKGKEGSQPQPSRSGGIDAREGGEEPYAPQGGLLEQLLTSSRGSEANFFGVCPTMRCAIMY